LCRNESAACEAYLLKQTTNIKPQAYTTSSKSFA